MDKTAVLDSDGKVMAVAHSNSPSIRVAGAITTSGDPVNVRVFKVSRSKRNLSDAARLDDDCVLIRHDDKFGVPFFTWA